MRTPGGIPGGEARKRALALALIAVLAAIAWQAARLGVADAYARAARAEIERMGYRSATQGELARAIGSVTQSLRYAPHDPFALETLAQLQLRQMHSATDGRRAAELARQAYANFRLALAARPTSALTWARLALAKLYLAEEDDELLAALRLSLELGRRDPGVPELASYVGLALWPRLDPELRQGVVRALGVSAARDAGTAFEIGKSYGRFDIMCDISSLKALTGKNCGPVRGPN
jgi:tetratricopeptide (TPR) repeat protein